MTQSDTLLQKEPVKEPAKRWRNWWRFDISLLSFDGRTVYQAGCHYAGPSVFPSRDVAEQRAADKLARSTVTRIRSGKKEPFARHAEYLGAYPEGERP